MLPMIAKILDTYPMIESLSLLIFKNDSESDRNVKEIFKLIQEKKPAELRDLRINHMF